MTHDDSIHALPDPWIDRLSEYLDGELDGADRGALEAHLESCANCRSTLESLRRVTARAATLTDRAPATDGWAQLRSSIEGKRGDAPLRLVDDAPRPARPVRRTFAFSLPQAAAAAAVLVAAWGGSLYFARSTAVPADSARFTVASTARRSDTLPGASVVASQPTNSAVDSAAAGVTPAAPARSAARAGHVVRVRDDAATRKADERFLTSDYGQAVGDLQRVFAEGRGNLDSTTVRALEESLRSIDRALRQARAALARDPSNTYLNDYLARTMRRKLEVLRDAAAIVNAST